MFIYKISNSVNNKVYIGQTIRPIEARFNRHIKDALDDKLNTHLARAIRLYGADKFSIEQVDTANTQEELTQKEHDWIQYYNSVEKGYNETDAINKCGGNTYKNKTEEEMEIIKEKIRKTKVGGKNPHATKVKCKNVETEEELFFNSMAEATSFFRQSNHQFISRRCRGEVQNLFLGKWMFAYQDKEYGDYTAIPNAGRAKRVKVKDLSTGEEKIFNTGNDADRYCGFGIGYTTRKLEPSQPTIIRNNYQLTLLS